MINNNNILQENEKRYPRFANFGELLFWSYANLQMLFVTKKEGKAVCDCMCNMIRAKVFKAYKVERIVSTLSLWYVIHELVKREDGFVRVVMDLPFNWRNIHLNYPHPEVHAY